MLLVWIGIITAIAIGILLLVRQHRLGPKSDRSLGAMERTIFTLQIGDVVQFGGQDWIVEGQLLYNQDGFTWLEYLLQDAEQIRWLSVEEDDRVEVALLEPTTALEVGSQPPPQLSFAGQSYRCIESGVAQMSRRGKTRQRQAEQCRYFDYQGPGEQVLSIEDWGGETEVTVGKRISPLALVLLPGEGRTVYGV